jgi:microcystin degradation protein MlrC
VILRRMIERGSERRTGPIWDPMAVRLCFMAGVGGKLRAAFRRQDRAHLRSADRCRGDGDATGARRTQTFVGAKVPLGDCAAIDLDGISVVLISKRTQAWAATC